MSLAERVAVAADPGFRARARQAAVGAALNIIGENPSGLGFADNAAAATKRQRVAEGVLHGGDGGVIERIVDAVASQVGDGVTDPSTITDTSINNAVAAVWNDFAGLSYGA